MNDTPYAVGGLILLILLIALIVRFGPTIKNKLPSFKWAGGFGYGRALLALAVGLIITLSVREFWQQEWNRWNTHWHFWLLVVLGNILFCWLFGRKKGRASGGGTHETGHRAGSGTGLLAALIILVAAGVVYLGKTEEDREQILNHRLARIQLGILAQSQVQAGQQISIRTWPVVVSPGVWTEITAERGMGIWWDVESSTESVLFYHDNATGVVYRDSRNQSARVPEWVGPYTNRVTAGGSVPVRLTVHEALMRR